MSSKSWRRLENGDWQIRVFRREPDIETPYVASITVYASIGDGKEPTALLEKIEAALT